MTLAEENYIKTIFALQQEKDKGVSTNSIASYLNTKAASVSDMLRKLDQKELISYEKYYGARLTEKGEKCAIMIIRRHRLWETFLVDKLNFGWEEVHEVAEQLEHVKSEKLINALDSFLNFPKVDPHGDPIPNANGDLKPIHKKILAECETSNSGIIIGVSDASSEFLKVLDQKKITLGSSFEILRKEPYDGSLELNLNDKTLLLTNKLAQNIFVKID